MRIQDSEFRIQDKKRIENSEYLVVACGFRSHHEGHEEHEKIE